MPQYPRPNPGIFSRDSISTEVDADVRTGEYTSLAEEASLEDSTRSSDGTRAVHKNLLPELCLPSCAIAFALYTGPHVLLRAPLMQFTPLHEENLRLHDIMSYPKPDPAFARMCFLCSVAFVAAAVHSATALIFIRRGSAQRSVSACAVCINLTAAHAHWMMGAGHSPTFDSCFGRTMHATRFAEWLSTLFLMMVMTNALDCLSQRNLLIEACKQVASVALGFVANAACQLSGDLPSCPHNSSNNRSNSCAVEIDSRHCRSSTAHWKHRGVLGPDDREWWLPSAIIQASKAHQLNLLLLLASCWLYASWLLKVWNEWQERLREQRAGTEVGLAHATQAAVLRAFAATAWTMFPVVYFLGVFNVSWFPPNVELYAYSVVDLSTKFMYANVLCNANLLNLWAEDRARAQIVRKEKANEAHRQFLR